MPWSISATTAVMVSSRTPRNCIVFPGRTPSGVRPFFVGMLKFPMIPIWRYWRKKIKVLLDFFQKIAVSKGRAFGRPPQRAKYPRRARREILNRPQRHPQMAQSPRRSRKAAVPTPSRGGGRRPFTVPGIVFPTLGRNRNPLPAAGASPRPTQRNQSACGKWRLPTSGGTQVPPYVLYWWYVRVCGLADDPRRPPRGGGGEGHGLRPGVAPSADGAWDDRGFRPLRRAGVSLAAASGSFAPCAARPGRCPWTPRFFEKNRVKLFILRSQYCHAGLLVTAGDWAK